MADVEAALAGARDVMAEWASEDLAARGEMRRLFARERLSVARLGVYPARRCAVIDPAR